MTANLKNWWKDGFAKGTYPLQEIFGSPDWIQRTKGEIAFLAHQLKLKKGTKILDICCGVGRHSIPLAKKGFDVTGIDISPTYLGHAKRYAKKNKVKIDFQIHDARKLKFKEEFDLSINLFSSLGYFTDASDDLKVMKGIYSALKPGGHAVVEIYNSTRILKIIALCKKYGWLNTQWAESKDGKLLALGEPTVMKKEHAFRNRFVFITKNSRKEIIGFNRIFTKAEMVRLFKKAGFKVMKIFGDLDGSSYKDELSPNLVVIGKRIK